MNGRAAKRQRRAAEKRMRFHHIYVEDADRPSWPRRVWLWLVALWRGRVLMRYRRPYRRAIVVLKRRGKW